MISTENMLKAFNGLCDNFERMIGKHFLGTERKPPIDCMDIELLDWVEPTNPGATREQVGEAMRNLVSLGLAKQTQWSHRWTR